jgi:CheY-like chemotaxis protein
MFGPMFSPLRSPARNFSEGSWCMGVRVLVAEDEALIALSLADLLEAEGYEVALAPDGADALDAARRLGDALAVLVTDLNMPRMGGEDLIRALRAERPGLPVVVVTGSAPFGGEEALRRHAGGDGPLLLLLKPPDYAELAAALRRATDAGAEHSDADRTAAGEAAPRMALAS